MNHVSNFLKISILIVIFSCYHFLNYAQDSVNLTYIAHSGFLISGNSGKVQVDGIFDEDNGKFFKPSAEVIQKEIAGEEPFDSISHIIVSHKDKDHCSPEYLFEQMLNNSNTFLITTNQVETLLAEIQSVDTISSRSFFTDPPAGTRIDTIINNIPFSIMFLQHKNDEDSEKENLGTIFTIDGIKIFHSGDGNATNLSEYQALDLANEEIDVALVPYILFEDYTGREILKYINAKAVVLMHIEISNVSEYKTMQSEYEDLPSIYFFDSVMTNTIIVPHGDTAITIEGALQVGFVEQTKFAEKEEIKFSVYPNPVKGKLNISIHDNLLENRVEIFSVKGELLYANRICADKTIIDITNYDPGVYIVKLNNTARKFVVR